MSGAVYCAAASKIAQTRREPPVCHVAGGMLTATVLAIFYIPLFFVLVRRGFRDGMKNLRARFGKKRDGGDEGDPPAPPQLPAPPDRPLLPEPA